MNQKEHEPKRARSKKSTNKNQHKPKIAQTKNGTSLKGHESKTAGTKKGTNQKVATCRKLKYFNQNTILLYVGIETQQMTAI